MDKKIIPRREILVATAGVCVLGTLGFVGYTTRSKSPGYLIGANQAEFICINLDTKEVRPVKNVNLAHSFVLWPHKNGCVLAPEKSGASMTLTNFASGTIEQVIHAPTPRLFYGHVALTPDRNRFYSSQVDSNTGEGFLVVYDARNFSILKEHQICVGGIHDIAFFPGRDDLIAFTSSGVRHDKDGPGSIGYRKDTRLEPSSVKVFDITQGKVVSSCALDDDSLIFGHLKTLSDGTVVAIATLFDGYPGAQKTKSGAAYSVKGDVLRKWIIPDEIRTQMKHELLSVNVDKQESFCLATNPQGSKTLLFEIATGNLIKVFSTDSQGSIYNPITKKWYFISQHTAPVESPEVVDLASLVHLSSAHFVWAPPDFLAGTI